MPELTGQLPEAQVRPSIQRGVTDTSTAQAIEAIGGIGSKLIEGARAGKARDVVSQFTGGSQTIDEVAPEGLSDPREAGPIEDMTAERVKQIEGLDTLSKITAAKKGGLRGDIAKARAGVAFRKALSDSPMFAPEIREAFSGFFKSSLDSQFFVDPKRKLSPAEVTRDKIEQEKEELSHRLGMSREQSDVLYHQAEGEKFSSDRLANQEKLTANDVATLVGSSYNSASLQTMSDLVSLAKGSGTGRLTPEQITEQTLVVRNSAFQLEKSLLDQITRKTNRHPTPDELDIIEKKKKAYLENATAFLSDVSIQLAITNQLDTVSKFIELDALNSFSTIAKLSHLGESAVKTYTDAISHEDFRAFAEKRPDLKTFIDTAETPIKGLNALTNKGLDFLLNPELLGDSVSKQVAAGLIKQPGVAVTVGREKLNAIIEEVPAAVSQLDSPAWRGFVDSGKMSVDDVTSHLETAMRSRFNGYYSTNGKPITDFSIVNPAGMIPGGPEIQRTETFLRLKTVIKDQDNKRLSNPFYSTIIDMTRVAGRFPELWRGKFDSPGDYIKSLAFPNQKIERKEEEGKAAKAGAVAGPVDLPAKAPSLTEEDALEARRLVDEGKSDEAVKLLVDKGLTPEFAEDISGVGVRKLSDAKVRELTIKQFQKEFPDLTDEEIRETIEAQ